MRPAWYSAKEGRGVRMKRDVRLRVNGRPVTLQTEASRTLLWVLRGDLELTGTKYGCGTGLCGSCTVVVDGKAVRSCLTSVGHVEGKDVVTVGSPVPAFGKDLRPRKRLRSSPRPSASATAQAVTSGWQRSLSRSSVSAAAKPPSETR